MTSRKNLEKAQSILLKQQPRLRELEGSDEGFLNKATALLCAVQDDIVSNNTGDWVETVRAFYQHGRIGESSRADQAIDKITEGINLIEEALQNCSRTLT